MLMKLSVKNLLVVFFAVNALFWGLFPHSVHCKGLALFSNIKCPPHSVHLITGVVCYFVALFIAQRNYLMS